MSRSRFIQMAVEPAGQISGKSVAGETSLADLSDAAVAVFAFAAYHQLGSGQPVKSVVRDDGKGHKADDAAVGELQAAGLAEIKGNDIAFTEQGLGVLSAVIERLRGAVRGA